MNPINISKKIDFFKNDDRQNLSDLTLKFKQFKAHNYQTTRSIKHFIKNNSNFGKIESTSSHNNYIKKIIKNFVDFNYDLSDLKNTSCYIDKFLNQNQDFILISNSKYFKKEKYTNEKDLINKIYLFIINNTNLKYREFDLSEYYSANKQSRILSCNSWGEYAKFNDGDFEIKQIRSNACGSHLLCPFCASRKASKIQKRVEDFFYLFSNDIKQKTILDDTEQIINNEFEINISEHTKKVKLDIEKDHGNILNYHWYYMVLTVKNDFDINKGLTHLRNSFEKIREKIKNVKRGKDKHTVFKILGAIYSIEITYSETTGFHPHINIMSAFNEKISDIKAYARKRLKNVTHLNWNSKLISDEWLSITGDSYITSCTPLPISKDNHQELKKHLMEILKYSLKFNSMDTNIMVELYPYLYKKRLFGTLGFMYGLGLDKIQIDEFMTSRNFQTFVMKYTDGIYNFTPKSEIRDIEVINETTGEIIDGGVIEYTPIINTKYKKKGDSIHELQKLADEFEERREY